MNKRLVGDDFENVAVSYLKEKDYDILEQNFRCRLGEIDIVAKNEGYLVFAEVKYRNDNRYGEPEYAVGIRKQQKIYSVAQVYLKKNGISFDTPIRFDVVSIMGERINIIKNAFGAM
ncbi:MAG: YraN family protein [Lachnospiraceae bacterium]|nr:YraN family protein [Lachnospiraceae bacterium]